ncbi:unnamed protein product [Linum tenue]|uniref:PGG domain-containing protein n=1 Tax=Linum tenue TaxID=586396 RepID=A0AAV0KJF5_9ROSI|nr:unnamed protein product [Linum tenue]
MIPLPTDNPKSKPYKISIPSIPRNQTSHGGNTSSLRSSHARPCGNLNYLALQRPSPPPQNLLKTSTPPYSSETPLHVSVLSGHLAFTTALLARNPNLASKLDSSKRSPLHFAAAEGHAEIVKALLIADKEACLVREDDGRIPLHQAAVGGHVEAIRELVSSVESVVIMELDVGGDSSLHLCLQYNHLKALKVLVEVLSNDGDADLINLLSCCHASCCHVQATRELSPKHFKTPEVRDILIQSGATTTTRTTKNIDKTPSPPRTIESQSNKNKRSPSVKAAAATGRKKTLMSWLYVLLNCLEYHYLWVNEQRDGLMIVATLIATVTYQSGINPPGGVWQQDAKEPDYCIDRDINTDYVQFSTTNSLYNIPNKEYNDFVRYNTIAFAASAAVILLILGGIPLRHQFCAWLLTQTMFLALTFMGGAYMTGLYNVTPDNVVDNFNDISNIVLWARRWCRSTATRARRHL